MTEGSQRKKATRSKQTQTPGISYTRARNQASRNHALAETLRELDEAVRGWESEVDRADEIAARIGSQPQPSFHPHVHARFDGYGALTALKIDQQALLDHSHSELSQIITGVLGRSGQYATDLMVAETSFSSPSERDLEVFSAKSRTLVRSNLWWMATFACCRARLRLRQAVGPLMSSASASCACTTLRPCVQLVK